MVFELAENAIVSAETKKQLLEEKQKIDNKANRFIRRQIMYKRFRFLVPIEIVLLIPYLVAISYFSGAQRFYGDNFVWMIIFLLCYVVSFYLFFSWALKSKSKALCKQICFYASVSAAEELENGNIVKGSFFAVRLFEFIKPFSEAEKVKLGHFKCSVKNLFLGEIEKLNEQKSAIGKAILADYSKRLEFSKNLYVIASSFFSESPSTFDNGVKALRFFADQSEKYFEPATYLQKHKKIEMTTKVLSEIGKITLVPILLFVLWLIFGYK